MASPTQACPCGQLDAKRRPLSLAACCGRFLAGSAQVASDAEQLMRSRYSAYVLGDAPYLQATWHPRTRPTALTLDAHVHWLGLEVKHHQITALDRAEVEFVARYREAGRGVRLHERSRFVREEGRWFYVDGDVPPVPTAAAGIQQSV